MNTQTVSTPPLNKQSRWFIVDNFESNSQGVHYALEALPVLYQAALKEIKGKFLYDELSFILDVFNGAAINPQTAGQTLIARCEHKIELDRLDKKWRVNKKQFLNALRSLSYFQRAALEIWANGYWHGRTKENKAPEDTKSLETLHAHLKLLF